MLEKSAVSRFVDKGEDAKVVTKLIERLREAIVCYQVGALIVRGREAVLTGGVDISTTGDLQSNHSSHGRAAPSRPRNRF